ncbi:MAG: 30S ribosomal protein S12 methylthiotransferase RimO, partial [Bacteroidota bacterium]
MRTKTTRTNRINVVTLGCSKNVVDSEVLMGQLQANDFEVAHEADAQSDDIVIINTCGFIDNAKQESIDTILHFAKEREQGKISKLIVTGCLSERYKPDLEKEISDVDHFFGTRDLPLLLNTLGADFKHELVGERMLTTPRHFAYLKISEGCDRPCSFCAIPLMRGGHISKPMEQLEEDARALAEKDTKELLIITQDSTHYGLDLYNERRLAELMVRLSKVEGIEWIK